MPYPTRDELKQRLGITDANQDARLQSTLNAARGAVENYCGYIWEQPNPVARLFDVHRSLQNISVFQISDPGLLSYTDINAWPVGQSLVPLDIAAGDATLYRNSLTGIGPFDRIEVKGRFDWCQITGVWGQALSAPAEVGETVMLLALQLYAAGSGASLPDEDAHNPFFDDGMIQFLLHGHRRYR